MAQHLDDKKQKPTAIRDAAACRRSRVRTVDVQAAHFHRRATAPDRHALPVLPAGPYTIREREVSPQHTDVAHELDAIADQVDPSERCGESAVLDEISLS